MLGTSRRSLWAKDLSACVWNLGDDSFEPILPSRWAIAHYRDTPNIGLSWPIFHHLCFLKSPGKSPPEIQEQGKWYEPRQVSVLTLKGLPFRFYSDKTSSPPTTYLWCQTGLPASPRAQAIARDLSWKHQADQDASPCLPYTDGAGTDLVTCLKNTAQVHRRPDTSHLLLTLVPHLLKTLVGVDLELYSYCY